MEINGGRWRLICEAERPWLAKSMAEARMARVIDEGVRGRDDDSEGL